MIAERSNAGMYINIKSVLLFHQYSCSNIVVGTRLSLSWLKVLTLFAVMPKSDCIYVLCILGRTLNFKGMCFKLKPVNGRN